MSTHFSSKSRMGHLVKSIVYGNVHTVMPKVSYCTFFWVRKGRVDHNPINSREANDAVNSLTERCVL